MEFKEFNDLPEMPDEDAVGEEEEKVLRPVLEEVRSLRKYTIPKYPMFIGRDRKAAICVSVSAVSRRHAKVFEREGLFYIQDMGSINGTFLNDKRILDPVELKEGDRIKVAITKDYQNGAKEFEFKYDISEIEKKEKEKKTKDHQILESAGLFSSRPQSNRSTIPLQDCLCYAVKRDLVSVLKSDQPRRVPLYDINLKKASVDFLSMYEFKPKDTLNFTFEHPRLKQSIKMILKITEVEDYPEHPEYKILLHKTEILKFPDEDRSLYKSSVETSPLICYVKSDLIDKE